MSFDVIVSGMGTATLLFAERRELGGGEILQARIWAVPEPVPPTTHGLKYSLVYVVAGRRVIGYDNERGKGDHRHYGDTEESYHFTTPDRLWADFLDDVRAAGGKV